MIDKNSRVFVAGHRGMVGSAIIRKLERLGFENILIAERNVIDLRNQESVNSYFEKNHIDCVIMAAAKVGGISANNSFPADFIYENLIIEANVINAANKNNVQQLLFLGSSCIYPRLAEQPMGENSLLSGPLEKTNEPYAIAKIAGIKLCESYNRQFGRDYRSIMPTNLYGPNDNFHPENSHVLPALIRRFHKAVSERKAEVTIWGSGNPKREFLHVDDLADASIFVLNVDRKILSARVDEMNSHLNVGTGVDHSISEIAEIVAEISGFEGQINYDISKPDGTPRKLLDVSLLSELGWKASIGIKHGIKETYEWYEHNINLIREV